jgi:hypothetical protein
MIKSMGRSVLDPPVKPGDDGGGCSIVNVIADLDDWLFEN